MKQLLLLSNSTNPGEGYLEYPKESIRNFLGSDVKKVLFVPYAAVTISFDAYLDSVKVALSSLEIEIEGIHMSKDPKLAISQADAIFVGGGNSFALLKELQKNDLVKTIFDNVMDGTPFIGWSAGSNLACPSIRTTNDMPIVEPQSFEGLGLIPFQINPHYTNAKIPNHGGESRDLRIAEFLVKNQGMKVVGLPEGNILKVEGSRISLIGKGPITLFSYGNEPENLTSLDQLQGLVSN